MKKSLIALAVLAASSAAMAQSSVTLYGRIDTSVGSLKDTGSSAVSKSAITKMFQGGDAGLTTSRWGLRGVEDLGGGLKASFKLENRFNSDVGTSQDPFFKGAAGDFIGSILAFHLWRIGRSKIDFTKFNTFSQFD